LKACTHHAVTADEWRLDASHCEIIEAVLRAYDAQLASLPVHKIEAANLRLGRILEKEGSFS
jgi:ribosomal protein L30E